MDCGTRGACTAWLAALSAADTHFSVSLSLPVSPSSISSLSLSLRGGACGTPTADSKDLVEVGGLRGEGCLDGLVGGGERGRHASLSLSLCRSLLYLFSLSLSLSHTHTHTHSLTRPLPLSPGCSWYQGGLAGGNKGGRHASLCLSLSPCLSVAPSSFSSHSRSLSHSLFLSHTHTLARARVCVALSL